MDTFREDVQDDLEPSSSHLKQQNRVRSTTSVSFNWLEDRLMIIILLKEKVPASSIFS